MCYADAAGDVDGRLRGLLAPVATLSTGEARQLELDLLAVFASDAALCFGCFLPLGVQDSAVAEASPGGDWVGLMRRMSVSLTLPRIDAGWTRLCHEQCAGTAREQRRTRGRAIVSLLAAQP